MSNPLSELWSIKVEPFDSAQARLRAAVERLQRLERAALSSLVGIFNRVWARSKRKTSPPFISPFPAFPKRRGFPAVKRMELLEPLKRLERPSFESNRPKHKGQTTDGKALVSCFRLSLILFAFIPLEYPLS